MVCLSNLSYVPIMASTYMHQKWQKVLPQVTVVSKEKHELECKY